MIFIFNTSAESDFRELMIMHIEEDFFFTENFSENV